MGEKTDRRSECSHWDQVFAIPMFVITVLFLLLTAILLHHTNGDLSSPLAINLLIGMGVLYLFFIAETVVHWWAGSANLRQHISFLLLPVMRLCPHDHIDGSRAWIPGIGWRKTTNRMERYLARIFSGPMIIIALLVLPVVAVEFFYAEKITGHPQRKLLIDSCSAFIWMAFVFEFVIMFSVVERRVRYCKQNWIDVAVVLLPFVSFMGAARLGRLLKLKQLSRTAKIYRMRGLALRSWRAVVALDVIDTLLRRDCEQRLEKIRRQIAEKEREIEHLNTELERVQAKASKPEQKKTTKAGGTVTDVKA